MECCKKSLAALGLEYVDLYLIHWPIAYQVSIKNTYCVFILFNPVPQGTKLVFVFHAGR